MSFKVLILNQMIPKVQIIKTNMCKNTKTYHRVLK